MKRQVLVTALLVCLLAVVHSAWAQRTVSVSGKFTFMNNENMASPYTRIGFHVHDTVQNRFIELTSIEPLATTFSLSTATAPNSELLTPAQVGALILPGVRENYTISPEGVNFVKGMTNVYIDSNQNRLFDEGQDRLYFGIASMEEPAGYFVPVYVDQDMQITTSEGQTLQFYRGWNLYTAQFAKGDGAAAYGVEASVSNALLDLMPPR